MRASRRPTSVIRASAALVTVVATLAVTASCTSGPRTGPTPSTVPIAATAPIATDAAPCVPAGGAWEVLVQVGDRELRSYPEPHLAGPTVVVYADATFYAVGSSEDGPQYVRGQLDACDLDAIVDSARALPDAVPATVSPADDYPVDLAVAERLWVVGYESPDPLHELLADISEAVHAAPHQPWTPARWIVRTGEVCSVVEQAPTGAWDAQPVYPHEIGERPLGATGCADV